MPMIPEKDAKFIREHLAKNMAGPVTIDYFTQRESTLSIPIPAPECMYCKETGDLLAEIAALSDKITLAVHDFVAEEGKAKELGIKRIPAFVLSGAAKGKVRFLGIPSGYEFASVIEDLVDVSKGETDLSPKAREELAALDRDIHIQVFVTPT